MDEYYGKVVDIQKARVNKSDDKKCQCDNRTYIINPEERKVYCSICGAEIEPFEAMYDIAVRLRELIAEVESLAEQREQLKNHKLNMVIFKELESLYIGKKMLPCCPHCNRGFYFEELEQWVDRKIEDGIRNR